MLFRSAARRQRIAELAAIPGTLAFFESPHRVVECLEDLAAVLGARPCAAARELTKRFEEVKRGTPGDLARAFSASEPRGEFVILVGPPDETAQKPVDVDALLRAALEKHSVKDAASVVSAQTGQPRRQVYARAIEIAARAREA